MKSLSYIFDTNLGNQNYVLLIGFIQATQNYCSYPFMSDKFQKEQFNCRATMLITSWTICNQEKILMNQFHILKV